MGLWRGVGAVGRLLVVLGVLILLFLAYLLWGTGLGQARHQSALEHLFDRAVAQAHRGGATPNTTMPGPSSSLVRQLAAGEAPADGQPIAIIDIPRIGVDEVVVQGTGTDELRLGPGHYARTPLPGQSGNVGIAGHRTTYGAPFYDLNDLTVGDPIVITTLQGHFTYRVTRTLVVTPSDVSVLDPTSTPTLTLTTCNPRFSASQRLVVHAALVAATGLPPAPPPANGSGRPASEQRSTNLAGAQGSWSGAALWGAGTLGVGLLAWLLGRSRRSRSARLVAYVAGTLPLLVLLYFFFENVSSLLPASF